MFAEPLGQARPLHGPNQQRAHLGRALGHDHISLLQSLNLCTRGSLRDKLLFLFCLFSILSVLTFPPLMMAPA